MTDLPAPLVRTAVIVVAAGSGTRLAAGAPKAFVPLDGRTILEHALDGVFAATPAQVILVVPAGLEAEATDLAADRPVRVVVGGDTRQRSVAAGLVALAEGVDTVLVHDAARALTPPAQFAAVAAAVGPGVGVIPALPVVDTLKRVHGEDVIAPVDRAELAAAQTPQGFPRAELLAAYAQAAEQGVEYTDDAALFAAAGGAVRHVLGSEEAFKITTPHDLERARMILSSSSQHPAEGPVVPRVGIGTDVHAFAAGGTLRLAGLDWPGEPALEGHSDGDAVAHAIVDALLGAAGLGDIGLHFGTAHPEYAGAHGEVFLARTAEILAEAGFAIGNVSVQFQGNRPRFSARRTEAERTLSAALGGAPVAVSATTTDGLGFPGRGEGIAVTAVALVHPIALS
ncbi:2-C-methyl-D-erythritol 4-phosphate cytidylyltransferase [uncultured Microbacterium sp.]|uniref:2-C-methyl-D-erythritol 4-phosphate cytidylyltransferase n=1 Tax=uncultured Microbacterium sp. TaxID=191216 RepID=UPI0025CDA6CE|nr:2-C-methyl-D-erythritol 4-phosphate cytidylyltransferase [uncultured Microbacterium sp.]